MMTQVADTEAAKQLAARLKESVPDGRTPPTVTSSTSSAQLPPISITIAPPRPRTVYQCIALVSADLARTGISKDRSNTQQGYRFRGIDDVYGALAPALAKHGLVILPRVVARTVTERTTQKGGVLFYVVLDVEFDFVSADDGSRHTVRTVGEAMDSADKATNKAMSAAYKYAAFMTFCIPVDSTPDADQTTPEAVAPQKPDGYDDWLDDFRAVADTGMAALKAAWKTANVAYRDYLTSQDAAILATIKKTAEDATVPA
jgi:hypothetical protein